MNRYELYRAKHNNVFSLSLFNCLNETYQVLRKWCNMNGQMSLYNKWNFHFQNRSYGICEEQKSKFACAPAMCDQALTYHIYPQYLDTRASDKGRHCLPLTQQFKHSKWTCLCPAGTRRWINVDSTLNQRSNGVVSTLCACWIILELVFKERYTFKGD